MATRTGDVDPTQRILQIEADLGDLRAKLRTAKGPKADTLRGNIAKLEQELIDVKKAEINLGKQAVKDGERAKRELNKAQQNRAKAYNKEANQINNSTREQAKQDRAEAASSSGGGFAPSGRVMRRGKLTRAGRGAVASAAVQGYEEDGAIGVGKNIGSTLIGAGLYSMATGAGFIPGLVTAGAGAAILGASKLAEIIGNETKRQLEVARQLSSLSSLRFRQFGSSAFKGSSGMPAIGQALSSKDYEKDYTDEITALATVQREAIAAGIHYGLEPSEIEELKSSMARIGAITGESYQEGVGKFFGDQGIVRQISKMHSEGLGTIDEITNKYIIAVRQYGMGPERALKSIQSVAQEARAISIENIAEAGTAASEKNVVLMEDFTSAVEEARGEIDSLVATEEGIAKAMRVGLRLANQLGMSQAQNRKGALELTKAMTGQRNRGFATVVAARDTDYLIKKYQEKLATGTDEEKAVAKAKLADLALIKKQTPDVQAKFLSEAGFDEDLFALHLKDAVASGNYHMMQAYQENPLGYEQYKLMNKISEEVAKGAKIEDVIQRAMIGKGGAAFGESAKKIAEEGALGRQEAIRTRRLGLRSKDDLKFYAEQAKDYGIAAGKGIQALASDYADVVKSTTDIIQNQLNVSFANLNTSVANATKAIEQSYKSLPVPVPTKSVPLPSGPSGAVNNGATVDAAGNVLIMVPASALHAARSVAAAQANSTGVGP